MSTITTEQLSTILVEKLDEKLAPLNSTVAELRKSLDEAIKHVKFVDAKYDDLLKKMKKDDEDRKALWTENKTLKLAVQTLEKQHASLELQLRNHLTESNEKNQYDRRECLEVRGIPQHATPSEENTNAIIIEVGKLIGVDILDNDISVSHRLPQAKSYKGKNVGPSPIIVKFTRRSVKERLYGARKNLRNKTSSDLGYSEENKIYLAESLTEKNRELFKECLAEKKNLEFKFIWTNNGRIYLRENNDSPVFHIKNKDDIQKLKGSIQAR